AVALAADAGQPHQWRPDLSLVDPDSALFLVHVDGSRTYFDINPAMQRDISLPGGRNHSPAPAKPERRSKSCRMPSIIFTGTPASLRPALGMTTSKSQIMSNVKTRPFSRTGHPESRTCDG